jgi:CPA1 family monovalent cation:H+ antiporter
VTTVQIAALIISLTAILAYVNARFIKLPSQIGLLAITLAASLIVVALDGLGVIDAAAIEKLAVQANFGPVLLHGMLGLLLFAGALRVNLRELRDHKWPVAVLSLGGTLLSTVLVGVATYALLEALGISIDLLDALLFGALISPTDPIAVLGVLKSSRVPRPIQVVITGESLFNDGVGVVVFTVLLAIATGEHVSGGHVAYLFVRQAIGGAVLGLVLGVIADRLLSSIDDYVVEVLITLALVIGGYALGEQLEVSAPIGAVVAGIVIGNHTVEHAMSETTREYVDRFWELVDEILNAVLFLMLGLEATRLQVSAPLAIAAVVAIPLVLAARFASVGASAAVLRPFIKGPPHALKLLTWGGLRGGLAVALALALPAGPHRDSILVITYAVVSFAILVQGLTLPGLLRRLGLA